MSARELIDSPTWDLLVSPVVVADCIDAMRAMPDCSVEAMVTDPPYGLEFMGKEWDRLGGGAAKSAPPGIGQRSTGWVSNRGWNEMRCRNCGHLSHGGSPCRCGAPNFAAADDRMRQMQAWHERWAREALRVLKPGGHLLAFGGTRTYHRLVCGIEDAGFEIRDRILYLNEGGDAVESLGPELDWVYGSG